MMGRSMGLLLHYLMLPGDIIDGINDVMVCSGNKEFYLGMKRAETYSLLEKIDGFFGRGPDIIWRRHIDIEREHAFRVLHLRNRKSVGNLKIDCGYYNKEESDFYEKMVISFYDPLFFNQRHLPPFQLRMHANSISGRIGIDVDSDGKRKHVDFLEKSLPLGIFIKGRYLDKVNK